MWKLPHIVSKPFKSFFLRGPALVIRILLVIVSSLFSADIAQCFDRSFAWDANTEPDIAGYRVYYKYGTSGPPYDGTGAIEGNSPIQVPLSSLNDPANPEFTIHDLSDTESVHFVCAAYDIYGNESDFSNELSINKTGCAADFEADDDVDGSDLAVSAADFGRANCAGSPCKGDFDNNNAVDGSDLAVLAAEFGRTDCAGN
jgi:hypothetical protein